MTCLNYFSPFLSGYEIVDKENRIMYVKSVTPIIFSVCDFDDAVEALMNNLRNKVQGKLFIMEVDFNNFLNKKINEANKRLGISQ